MRRRAARTLILCLALAGLLTAAEQVVLDNGMRLNAERTERQDGRLVLYTAGGGSIELDAARVISIEKMPEPPQAPDAPAGLPQPSAAAPPAASSAAGERPVQDLLTDAALRYGLPPAIVHSVAQAESGYRASAISPKGAIGVMQLMPGTARQLDADPANVVQNIDAGTRLLRELLLKYQDTENGVRRALAAYNAGVGAVERFGGVPPYPETQSYVERVIELYWKNVRAAAAATPR
ncbi:MAG: lytic transglycosylase domain-containing protein [Bryobacteraceae bacterium]